MRKAQLLVSALLLVLLMAACVPKVAPMPAPQANAPAPALAPAAVAIAPAKPAWQVDWEKTLEAAKKEGNLLVYTGAGPVARDALYKAFLERHGIKIESVSGRVGELAEKIVRERRAGLYFTDMSMTTAVSTLYPILKPKGLLEKLDPILVLPEVLDPKVWMTGGLRWLDPDHVAVAGLTYVSPPIIINATQVREEELRAYTDLLNSKWRGQVVTDDPTAAGMGSTLWATVGGKVMGWDFVQEFAAKQQPIISRDARQEVEWVARGKYPVGMALSPEIVSEFIRIGAPLKLIIPKEGAHASSSWGLVSILTQAPHPNAAKVFANWFLSKEGQTVAVKASGLPSLRLDVSAEGIDPARVMQPGAKYIFNDEEGFGIEVIPYREKAKEIFTRLTK